ncbi:MAG: T9SS type A sorting domain-containing protein [Chitinophagales bacterium]|nr:T9SS type A sorting domain-containing protein [Chitinophagales bacterium]
MKKFLLASLLMVAFGFTNVNAQIVNAGFENWDTSTAYFSGFNLFPADTFPFADPQGWTTTNALTGADTLGGLFLINESANAHAGSKAISVTTDRLDSIDLPSGFGRRALTIPGLALNGVFPLDLGSNLLTGGVISPTSVPGSGQPFTQRLATIKGFFNYAPVYNSILSHVDSCMIWAVLRKGDTEVASAQFTSGDTTNGYRAFSANFVYSSCEQPDTLVILIAASIPALGSVITGTTDLVPGSVLLVDDLDYDLLPGNTAFAPFAVNDLITSRQDSAITILVKDNDDDCDNPIAGLTLAITQAAAHGTATLNGNASIGYTPNAGYVGADTLFYSITDAGNNSDTARVRILVFQAVGINEANLVSVAVFPVPANNELNIQFENNGKATLRIFDMVGNLVKSTVVTKNNNVISVADLANGVYGIQIANENNVVVARTKFTVSK